MWRCKLWFVFLLRLTLCFYNKAGDGEQLEKTIGKEVDFTPVCSNYTQNPITFVVCRISPMRTREEECSLTYRLMQGFEQGCDSRFSLVLINQTILLQLKNLTPENSGNCTCQCSQSGGTSTIQLNITVEDNEDTAPPSEITARTNLIILIGVLLPVLIILLGVIPGCIFWQKCHRRRGSEVTTTVQPNTDVPDIEPYRVFKENELYLTSMIHTSTSTTNLIVVGIDNPGLGRPL